MQTSHYMTFIIFFLYFYFYSQHPEITKDFLKLRNELEREVCILQLFIQACSLSLSHLQDIWLFHVQLCDMCCHAGTIQGEALVLCCLVCPHLGAGRGSVAHSPLLWQLLGTLAGLSYHAHHSTGMQHLENELYIYFFIHFSCSCFVCLPRHRRAGCNTTLATKLSSTALD